MAIYTTDFHININVDHQLQYVGNKEKYIEKTKTAAGTRVLPMTDDVYKTFKRIISSRKKLKVETMIDGYTGFLFLDNRGNPMPPYPLRKCGKTTNSIES